MKMYIIFFFPSYLDDEFIREVVKLHSFFLTADSILFLVQVQLGRLAWLAGVSDDWASEYRVWDILLRGV